MSRLDKIIQTSGFLLITNLYLTPAWSTEKTNAPPDTPPVVEITHWWKSVGELAGVDEIKKAVTARGATIEISTLKDIDEFRSTIIEQIGLGYLPAATHWLAGKELMQLKNQNVFLPMPEKIGSDNIKDILFSEVLSEMILNNELVALPLGIHLQNTVYYNAAIYDELKLKPAETWAEFLEQAAIIKKAGYIPVALSTEAWQVRNLLDSIFTGLNGSDAFKQLYENGQSIKSLRTQLIDTFKTFLQLQQYTDPTQANNEWVDNIDALAAGKVAAYFLGDYSKGELVAAKYLTPDKDFYCELAPGNAGAYIYGIDAFALFKVSDPALIAGQELLVDTVLSPAVQAAYISKKGGIPVRKDVDISSLDACAAKMYQGWLNPANKRLPYPGGHSRARLAAYQDMGVKLWKQGNPDVEGAVDELISTFESLGKP